MKERVHSMSGLSRARRFWLFFVAGGLWLSGVLWLVFQYFIQRKTEFGPRPWPIQHWWLTIHGAFAFGALWFMGVLWGSHIPRLWRTSRHRLSGSVLFGGLLFLAATGYLLYYYSGPDDVRELIGLTHWILGLSAILPFAIHWLRRHRS
jgi:hypothetical protein